MRPALTKLSQRHSYYIATVYSRLLTLRWNGIATFTEISSVRRWGIFGIIPYSILYGCIYLMTMGVSGFFTCTLYLVWWRHIYDRMESPVSILRNPLYSLFIGFVLLTCAALPIGE